MRDERSLSEWALISERQWAWMKLSSSSLVYSSLGRTSMRAVSRSGTTLCCVPALTTVTVIRVSPSSGLTRSKRWSRSQIKSSSAS